MSSHEQHSVDEVYQPSRNQVLKVRAEILSQLYGSEQLAFDRLAEMFQNELRPTDVEVAEQFGAVIRSLQDDNLIEVVSAEGMPSFKLTDKGRERVERAFSLER